MTFSRAWVFEPTPGSIRVDLYTNYECWACSPGFTGTRSGDTLHFVIVGGPPGDGTVVQPIGASEVRYEGTGAATLGDGKITGTFSGQISVWNSNEQAFAVCTAPDHKMDFVQ